VIYAGAAVCSLVVCLLIFDDDYSSFLLHPHPDKRRQTILETMSASTCNSTVSGHVTNLSDSTLKVFDQDTLASWPEHHPCRAAELGWPMRELQRRVYIALRGGIACAVGRGLADRAQKTRRFLLGALANAAAEGVPLPDFKALSVGVHDGHCNEVMLAYATFHRQDGLCKALLIPSSRFADEPEQGVTHNQSHAAMILRAVRAAANAAARGGNAQHYTFKSYSHHVQTTAKCGWIGNPRADSKSDTHNPPGMTQPVRERLLKYARDHTELLEIIDSARSRHLSYEEQAARWQCLIDVRGAGYSDRVPALLFTGKPMLYVERPGLHTYYESPSFLQPLVPWQHYVPVKPDLTDLAEQAQWVLRNNMSARRIGMNALAYARCYLTVQFAREWALAQILKAAAQRDDPPADQFTELHALRPQSR
jgi:hypothetical protein